MLKYSGKTINEWSFGDDNIVKVYRGVKGSAPLIPSGYTELEYCTVPKVSVSNSNKFIVPYEFQPYLKYSMEFTPLNFWSSSYYAFLCGDNSVSTPAENTFMFFKLDNGWGTQFKRFIIKLHNYLFDTRSSGTMPGMFTVYDNVKAKISTYLSGYTVGQGAVIEVENEGYETFTGVSTTLDGNSWTPNYGIRELGLFALGQNSPDMNFHNFRIETSGGTAVYDYRPVKRNSDEKVGVYDVVNQEFYYPSGFTLTAGTEVQPSTAYEGIVAYYKVTTSGGTPEYKVCYAVVDDISQYSETEFEDVFDKATEKWYKLNNLNQYEEYGVYASGRTECSSRLPQGYTEVEYIENTSQAYINLGVDPYSANGNSFTVECTISSYTQSGLAYLLSTECTTSPYYGFVFRYNSNNLEFDGASINGASADTTAQNTLNADGTSAVTLHSDATSTNNCNVPLTIFCGLNGSPWRYGKGKLYYLKMTLNNSVVRELIPSMRDSDNKYGMYDLVTDTFYLSPNGNDFSGGSAVTPTQDCVTTYEGKLTIDDGYEYIYSGGSWVNVGEVSGSSRVPVGYTEVEYIENTTKGTNYYIDTQFKPNQDTRVIVEAQASVLNNNPRIFGSGPWNGLAFVGNIENVSPQKFYFKYGQTSTWWQTNVTADTNKHTFDLNKNSYYIDNVLANTASTSTFQLTTNLGIFNAPATSLFNNDETFIGKVFSCKIYDNGTLIRDFVPCYRDSDSKSGLYDVVNDVFYTAVNTSYNFTLGAETGTTVYPLYYDDKSDPLNNLTFSSMTEANEYAYNNCVYDGLRATIDGDLYTFDSDEGWVEVTY